MFVHRNVISVRARGVFQSVRPSVGPAPQWNRWNVEIPSAYEEYQLARVDAESFLSIFSALIKELRRTRGRAAHVTRDRSVVQRALGLRTTFGQNAFADYRCSRNDGSDGTNKTRRRACNMQVNRYSVQRVQLIASRTALAKSLANRNAGLLWMILRWIA